MPPAKNPQCLWPFIPVQTVVIGKSAMMCIVSYIMPARSQRPLVNRLLALEPLEIGSHRDSRLGTIDEAVMMMGGGDFSPEQLAAALDAQTDLEVSVATLYRWRRELAE